METKTRRMRFEEVAGSRVQLVLDKIESLSKCANKKNYEYTQKDIQKMFRAVNDELRKAKMKFEDELSDSGKAKKVFKF